jgi:hypothetical protein
MLETAQRLGPKLIKALDDYVAVAGVAAAAGS